MIAETGIKVGNVFVAYKLNVKELMDEIFIRLRDCKNDDDFKRFENNLLCFEFLNKEIFWDAELNKGQFFTNFVYGEGYFELDFKKKKIIYIHKSKFGEEIWDALIFDFDDDVWGCYDEINPKPIFIVIDKIITEQDNFIVVKEKNRRKYYLIKDKTYIIKESNKKDVLTKTVLDILKG